MKNKLLPIRLDGIHFNNWLKEIFWVTVYEWDETPYGLTITIFGFNFDFLLGRHE